MLFIFFSFKSSVDLRYLHSFPTRRSSDLDEEKDVAGPRPRVYERLVPGIEGRDQRERHDREEEDDVDRGERGGRRSEEHTSELQSRFDLVCRLLLEKKKKK